jgi:hypothetical protein
LAHAEELVSDVLERFSESAPDIRQQLLDAKAAVGRAKDAVTLQASSRAKSASEKAASKAVMPAKTAKKHGKARFTDRKSV